MPLHKYLPAQRRPLQSERISHIAIGISFNDNSKISHHIPPDLLLAVQGLFCRPAAIQIKNESRDKRNFHKIKEDQCHGKKCGEPTAFWFMPMLHWIHGKVGIFLIAHPVVLLSKQPLLPQEIRIKQPKSDDW